MQKKCIFNADLTNYYDLLHYLSLGDNEKESVDLSRSVYLVLYDKAEAYGDLFKTPYMYPDVDLCWFQAFPHRQLVVPLIINSTASIACTCTIVWLVQYADVYKRFDSKSYSFLHEHSTTLKEHACHTQIICNFTHLFTKCFHSTQHSIDQMELGFFEDTNFLYHFKWLQYAVAVFIQPVLCLISILTNALIIATLRNKTHDIAKNLANNVMYSHIQVNSAFNIVYSLIKLTSLLNICIFPRTSFCSQVYKKPASQYFKIYVVYFVGNAIRLCMNTSYICFSVSRFYLATSNPSRFFKKFQTINLTRFYSLIGALSLGFSLFKVFQFEITALSRDVSTDYPFDKYSIEFCQIKQAKKFDTSSLRAKCQLFDALKMINSILNNMLFLFISCLLYTSPSPRDS